MRKVPQRHFSKRLALTFEPKPIVGLAGWREAHLTSVGSTNDDLTKYASSGFDADRLWLTAGEQKSGRGRRGRNWVSPHGNFHGSLYLHNPCDMSQVSFLPIVCAVAVNRAIANVLLSAKLNSQIKWPNDILIDGAKCCGMLIEAHHHQGYLNVVIGCGINLVAHPDDTPYPAIDLKSLGLNISTHVMLHHLAASFDEILALWNRGTASAEMRSLWMENALSVGQLMVVNLANGTVEGICEGIDANGLLLLRESSGKTHEISAGDVFFPHLKLED